MGPYKVHIQPSALIDIQQARRYYRNISLLLVRALNSELDAAINQISKTPFAYGLRYDSNRRYNLRKFPFAIFYVADEATQKLHITAFIHNSRNYPSQSGGTPVLNEP